jgi:hypothetical protein
MKSETEITFSFRRYPEEGSYNIGDYNVGGWLYSLLDERGRVADQMEEDEDSVTINAQRAHEWELIVAVSVVAAPIFATAFLEGMASRLADSLFDFTRERVRRGFTRPEDQKILIRAGDREIELVGKSPERMTAALAEILAKQEGKSEKVTVLLPF